MQEIITTGAKQTQQFAKRFVKKLNPGDILCLYGNLGAGKTTFVQGLIKGFGIERRVISPTFVIIRSYTLPYSSFGQNDIYFYHVDLYRLSGEKDLESSGLPDILQNKNAIIAIEWPEKMGSLLPKKRWEIRLEYIREDKRKITVKGYQ